MENVDSIEAQTELKALLDYDPETGIFRWKVSRRGKVKPGQIAGNVQAMGYRYVPFRGRLIGAHRLAWLYVYGRWPTHDIDHINRVRDDNRIANLREATRSENMRNMIRRRSDASPYSGVCWDKQAGRWLACITSDGKQIHLGRYDTAEDAHAAYVQASKEVHGRFSPF